MVILDKLNLDIYDTRILINEINECHNDMALSISGELSCVMKGIDDNVPILMYLDERYKLGMITKEFREKYKNIDVQSYESVHDCLICLYEDVGDWLVFALDEEIENLKIEDLKIDLYFYFL